MLDIKDTLPRSQKFLGKMPSFIRVVGATRCVVLAVLCHASCFDAHSLPCALPLPLEPFLGASLSADNGGRYL